MAEQGLNGQGEKPPEPAEHRIIVIGASAGGFEAIKTIVKDLPPDLDASVFIVWHMSSTVRGVMPEVLNRLNTLFAAHAYDDEPIVPNRIYIAQPDHHLLIEEGKVKVTHGPKENRFRPAIDPLFRSAAYTYGPRVIGIVLSGALDDGTAGLWRIKASRGVCIVQDPYDAEVSSMPASALRAVKVDHCVPVASIAGILTELCREKIMKSNNVMHDDKTKTEIDIAEENNALVHGSLNIGELSPFTCPECHGVLSKIMDGNLARFRCHTGHAYSIGSLIAALTENIEASLYTALRGVDESVMLLNHIGDHLAEQNQLKLAAVYFRKAREAMERGDQIRKTVFSHEQLSRDSMLNEAGEEPATVPTTN